MNFLKLKRRDGRLLLATSGLFLLTACGDDSTVSSGSDSDSGTSESDSDSTDSTASTTAGPGTATTDSSSSGSSSGGDPLCGDGEVEGDEECDNGDDNGQSDCTAECTAPVCGDGIVYPFTEVCDDGINDGGYGGCTADCQALGPHCGDGEVYDGPGGAEACDDGVNDDSYGGCATDCQALAPHCGDGEVNGPPDAEACDDGDGDNGDGCNVDCVVSGTALWTDIYPGPDVGATIGHGITVDGAGDVYVVGEEFVLLDNQNIMIRKYSADGELLWHQGVNGPGSGVDIARGVAVDSEDNVIVVGEVFVALENADTWIRKLTGDGDELWTVQHNGADSLNDRARGVAVDRDDNIVVTGSEYHLIGLTDVWTAKYGPDGGLLWIDEYNHAGGNDAGYGVSIGADDQIFVVGGVYEFVGLNDIYLRAHDPDGVELWTVTIDNWSGIDRARGASVDSEGNLVMVGETYTPDDLTNIWMGRYAAVDGAQLWVEWYDSEGGDNDIGYGVAVDRDDNVIIGGSTYAVDTLADALVAKYSAGGEPLWEQQYMGDGGNDRARAVATDAQGYIYAAGNEYSIEELASLWVTKYAP